MKLMLDIDIPKPVRKITYNDRLMLIGSCFTGNVGRALEEAKFDTLHNPAGIVFDPLSAAKHLHDLIEKRIYSERDIFQLNDLWSSWHHHSEFSSVSKAEALSNINKAIERGVDHLAKTSWLMITLGTSYSYQLREKSMLPVANCHKAPSQWFDKRLLTVDEIISAFEPIVAKLFENNKDLNIVFTVSPVRHVRDGVIENNRSKARLIEAVHLLTEKYDRCTYFPAYELVIDVLRDYRFYDADLVHPNYLATQYVFDAFCSSYMDASTLSLMDEIRKLVLAKQHRPLHPGTSQYKQFLSSQLQRTKELQARLPLLDWNEELDHFSK
jgi:hypothetical protein